MLKSRQVTITVIPFQNTTDSYGASIEGYNLEGSYQIQGEAQIIQNKVSAEIYGERMLNMLNIYTEDKRPNAKDKVVIDNVGYTIVEPKKYIRHAVYLVEKVI